MKTLVSFYRDREKALEAIQDLENHGFSSEDLQIVTKDALNEPNFDTRFSGYGFPESDASLFAASVERGWAMVIAHVDDEQADKAMEIMNRHEPVDIGYKRPVLDRNLESETERDIDQDVEATIPVVEEEMRVGKREVDTGGVRVHTFVQEKPFEETVQLRREHVNVERHPVDRPARPEDLDDFEERTIEVTTKEEEPVVEKRAHVVEEVDIDKDVREEPETVRDTVRKTDVEVEDLEPEGVSMSHEGWGDYDQEFRNHFTETYSSTGNTYDEFRPYYEYGYNLADEGRFRNRNWSDIEMEARRDWERRYPGRRWNDYSEAIRTGWEARHGLD